MSKDIESCVVRIAICIIISIICIFLAIQNSNLRSIIRNQQRQIHYLEDIIVDLQSDCIINNLKYKEYNK